jgi:AcrR family transcriptional regulator
MTTTPAARSLRERQRQEREDLILQAAEELFLEKGFYDTSIDDIAARVGIAKGTVYLHFASKEELVFALLQRDVRQLLEEVDGILALSESATARLRAIMERVYSGMLGSYFQMLTAVYQDPEFRARMAKNHTVMHATFSDVAQRIRAVLEEGKAAGEFDPAIPTSVMLRFFFALLSPRTVFGGRVTHRASGLVVVQEDISAEDVVEYLSRCFFRGIAPEGPSQQQ